MGFLGNFMKNLVAKEAHRTCEVVMQSYRQLSLKYPNDSQKRELYWQILTERFQVVKTMSGSDIERTSSNCGNIVELILCMIAFDNPKAFYESYEQTIDIVEKYMQQHMNEEYVKFKSVDDIPYAYLILDEKITGTKYK
jgi:hypothetical protein